jgi:magnesium-transporting ATPase (P-type)
MENKIKQGLSLQQVELSRKEHGENVLTQKKLDSFWVKFVKGLTEPMIIILLVALAVQIILFVMGKTHWFEPLGVLFAIIVANTVSAYSEKKQEGKASALKSAEELKESGLGAYYIEHTGGIWPQAAGGVPFNACEFQSEGDPITDLFEDLAA